MKPESPRDSRAAVPGAVLALALLAACGKRESAPQPPGLSGGDTAVLASPSRTTFSGQGAVRLERRWLSDILAAPVRIEADERLSRLVVAPAEGRLEEVHIRTPEQWIRQGERIVTLYSPELVAAQREFLLVAGKDPALSAAARERLGRMGLTIGQIRALRASGRPLEKLPLLSPKSGYVLVRSSRNMPDAASEGASPGMDGSMGGGSMGDGMTGQEGMGPAGAARMPESGAGRGPELRAGMSVSRGTVLARINDLSRVAAVLTLPAGGLTAFRAGDSVHIAMASLGFEGPARLDFLESRVVDTSGNVQGIAYLPNPDGHLKLGALGQAHVFSRPDSAWALPQSAIHALGERHIVWARSRADTTVFEAREVRIGRSGGGFVEVLEGLEPGSAAARNAALLLDPDVVLEPVPLARHVAMRHEGHREGDGTADDHSAHAHAQEVPASRDDPAGHGGEHGQVAGAESDHAAHGAGEEGLELTAEKARLADVRTARVDSLLLAPAQVFRAVVRLDERSQAVVPARVEGRIEQDAVLRVGERVRAGQILAYLLSEPFLAAQEEYLVARRSTVARSDPELIRNQARAARRRLEVMGMPSGLADGLERRGRVYPRLPVLAPRDGILLSADAEPGQYVQPGQALFTIGIGDKVWVETWLLAHEAASIPEGTEASVQAEGIEGGPLPGRLEHIQSGTTQSGSAVLAHIGLPNPEGRLLPGMQAWVSFRRPGRKVLAIPPSALLPAGDSHMVWIATGRFTYAPRMVEIGLETSEGVEVREGLSAGETVVVSGAYLLNSEYIIRKGAGKVHAGH